MGSLNFQPTEFVKVTLIVLLAAVITTMGMKINKWKNMGCIVALTLPVTSLVAMDNPNSGIIVCGVAFVMLFVSCEAEWPFSSIDALGLTTLVFAGPIGRFLTTVELLQPYQYWRIKVWLNPESGPADKSPQVLQGLYAIGSGGPVGQGLGESIQRLSFLLESQNDMTSAIICEEPGLFGTVSTILIFLFMIYRFMAITNDTPGLSGALSVVGVTGHITTQVILNTAVMINTIPNMEIILLFTNYGGTSVPLLLMEVGIVLNVFDQIKLEKQQQEYRTDGHVPAYALSRKCFLRKAWIPKDALLSVIQVCGLTPSEGEVSVQGSKNAVLPTMVAAPFRGEVTVPTNIPVIRDMTCMPDILESLGCRCCRKGDCLVMDTRGVTRTSIPEEYVTATRSSIVVLNVLLGRMGESSGCYSSGCLTGTRPTGLHLTAPRVLGADIRERNGTIKASCRRKGGLKGAEIYLSYPGVGATEQAILASVLVEGVIIIHQATREPEINQLCYFLNNMGAVICGTGADHLTAQGVAGLHDGSFRVEGGRIMAGTYGAVAVATGGEVLLRGICPSDLKVPLKEF